MPIPPFDETGNLPEGIHECTLDEVEERFGRFQRSDRRIRLFDNLKDLVKNLRLTGMAVALIVDGSFATAIPEPSDIDLVVALKKDHDFEAQLRPFEYNAITKRGVRRRYRFDLFAFCAETRQLSRQVQFFQRVRGDENRRKGVLRIGL